MPITKECHLCKKPFSSFSIHNRKFCSRTCYDQCREGTLENRINRYSIPTPNGCIEWDGNKNKNGYGMISISNKRHQITRLIYTMRIGPIPDNMFVCHRCDNPNCINPSHLFLGSALDNSTDMVQKGRQAKGNKNGNSKLDEEKVITIRSLHKNGYSLKEISRQFNISKANTSDIVNRKTWIHVAS